MTIRRQHENTTIPELRGATCSAFCAIRNEEHAHIGPLYLQLGGTWHRFYLDAGLLFWEEGPEPEPEEDLLEGEHYVDFGAALRVKGNALAEIEMHESKLRVEFENGARLVLKNEVRDDGTQVLEQTSAQA